MRLTTTLSGIMFDGADSLAPFHSKHGIEQIIKMLLHSFFALYWLKRCSGPALAIAGFCGVDVVVRGARASPHEDSTLIPALLLLVLCTPSYAEALTGKVVAVADGAR